MKPLTLRLPFPPPLSALFTNVPKRGRVPTKRYLTWQRAAMNEIMVQNRPKRTFPGYVHLHIILGAPDKRERDWDNHGGKAIGDTLVKMGVIVNDSNRYVRRGTIEWADVTGCVVTVAPLVMEVA